MVASLPIVLLCRYAISASEKTLMPARPTSPSTATPGRQAQVLRRALMDTAGVARVRPRRPQDHRATSAEAAANLGSLVRGARAASGRVIEEHRQFCVPVSREPCCRSIRLAARRVRFLTGSSAMVPPRSPSERTRPTRHLFLHECWRCRPRMASFVAVCRETSSIGSALFRSQRVLGVHDAVAVSLFSEEPLAVGGEVSVHSVTGDDGVETSSDPFRLGPQQPAEPLRLLLAGAEGT